MNRIVTTAISASFFLLAHAVSGVGFEMQDGAKQRKQEIAIEQEIVEKALQNAQMRMPLPDGTYRAVDFTKGDGIRFALWDVDGDKQKELLIQWLVEGESDAPLRVYGFNERIPYLYTELETFQKVQFYQDGTARSENGFLFRYDAADSFYGLADTAYFEETEAEMIEIPWQHGG